MEYESLSKVYYKRPLQHKKIYSERFNSASTRHFDFNIQEYGRQNAYQAFFCYTEEFALITEKIYQRFSDVQQVLSAVPPLVLEQFILFCVVDEVRATSDIEGVHSTRKEIKDVINGEVQSARFSGIVAKYKSIISNDMISFSTCEDIRKFYDEFIHSEVVSNNPANRLDGALFRKDSVDITSSSGKILHRGVQPEQKIIENLSVALEILNDEAIPLLARLSVFHYFFEYIHPFYDGNGRTARFIISYYLARHFNPLIALRLSTRIKKNKKKYYELFRETDSEWNCGDLTPFVLGFSEIISATFDEILMLLDNKINQLIRYQQRLDELISGDELTKEIYHALLQSSVFFGGGISMEDLMKVTRKSRNTIKSRMTLIPPEHIIVAENKFGKKMFRLDLLNL